MLVISSGSIYYLVADYNFEYEDFKYTDIYNYTDGGCAFTLFGGYKMWSHYHQIVLAGLPIMSDYPQSEYEQILQLGIGDDGTLSLRESPSEKILWTRRTHCDTAYAYYYYSMNKSSSLDYSDNIGIYSIDCSWAMVISREGPINIIKNINLTKSSSEDDEIGGEIVTSIGGNVEEIVFNSSGSFGYRVPW